MRLDQAAICGAGRQPGTLRPAEGPRMACERAPSYCAMWRARAGQSDTKHGWRGGNRGSFGILSLTGRLRSVVVTSRSRRIEQRPRALPSQSRIAQLGGGQDPASTGPERSVISASSPAARASPADR